MRKLIPLTGFMLIVSLPCSYALAQQAPRTEVAVTYDWTRSNAPPAGCGCFALNGGSGSFAYRIHGSLSAVGEIGVGAASNVDASGDNLTVVDFLAGARLAAHFRSRFRPFGELLVGGAHSSGKLSSSELGLGSATALAFQTGGGVDLSVTRTVQIRVVQADYLLTLFPNGSNNYQNNLRLSTGVGFRF